MTSLKRRFFKPLTQGAEVLKLRRQVIERIDANSASLHQDEVYLIKDSVTMSTKRCDADALKVYLDISLVEHHTLEFAIDAVREALGVREVHGVITVDHAKAYEAIEESFSDAIRATDSHVNDYPDGNFTRIAGVALRDLERVPEVAALIRERCIREPRELTELLESRKPLHSALAEGAL